MTTSDMQHTFRLGIAIDHRIRPLFGPAAIKLKGHSDHVSYIRQLGRSLNRSPDEIQVTSELAGPAVQGGIAIILQQPRDDHRFDEGIDSVIDDCETLKALYETFSLVSQGTLNVGADICIVDLLPYVSKDIEDIDDEELRKSFKHSVEVICKKKPDFVVCAGRIFRSDSWDIKGDAVKLEHIGIGSWFGQEQMKPVQTSICGENGIPISIERINAFHPSFAMNHWPLFSCFRQLLILTCAEACVRAMGKWRDRRWMNEIKLTCKRKYEELLTVAKPETFSDFKEFYLRMLRDFAEAANKLLSLPNLAANSTEAKYDALLSSNLSGTCNDACLVLRKMDHLCVTGGDGTIKYETRRALYGLREGGINERLSPFSSILRPGLTSIIKSSTGSVIAGPNLIALSTAFLKFAEDIEMVLLGWLPEKQACVLEKDKEQRDRKLEALRCSENLGSVARSIVNSTSVEYKT